MNKTCNLVILDRTKRHVLLSKLNFLGFERKPSPKRIDLANIRYLGEYENTFITFDNYGLLPSVARYMQRDNRPKENQENQDSEENKEEEKEENIVKSKNNYRYFYKFMANNEVYLVPRDHEKHDEVCVSNDLLLAIMKAKQQSVFDYDFTEIENKTHAEIVQKRSEIKEILEFKGLNF